MMLAYIPSNDLEPSAGDPFLVSTLAADLDLQELLLRYVRDLAERSDTLVQAYRAGDIETLKRHAHQLKGTGGGYGFPRITEAASVLERDILAGSEPELLERHVLELVSLCRRARVS
jgi:HPt (histidine-containing phosphotransfer) domain-containing protein